MRTMTSATTSYGQLFVHRGLQVSQQTSFCISPDGLRLLSSTTSGTLMVVDTRIGHAQIIVDTGSDSLVTSIVWVNNSQALLATHDGHLFSISFKNAIAVSAFALVFQSAFAHSIIPFNRRAAYPTSISLTSCKISSHPSVQWPTI